MVVPHERSGITKIIRNYHLGTLHTKCHSCSWDIFGSTHCSLMVQSYEIALPIKDSCFKLWTDFLIEKMKPEGSPVYSRFQKGGTQLLSRKCNLVPLILFDLQLLVMFTTIPNPSSVPHAFGQRTFHQANVIVATSNKSNKLTSVAGVASHWRWRKLQPTQKKKKVYTRVKKKETC